MQEIDLVQINFNPEQLFILNICLGIIMFGVALDIRLDDFKKVFDQPKSPIIGLISQLILLPIMTLLLIYCFGPATSVALGMVLVAACPGGNVSNFATHLAKGNAALSITLTSIVTILAIVVTPLSFTFFSRFVHGSEALISEISVDFMQMFQIITTLVVLPLAFGMFLNKTQPELANKIKKPIKHLSMLLFLAFIFFAIRSNYEHIVNHLHQVFFIVLVHNSLALLMGYSFAKANKLSTYDSKAIALETGIQNSGLGLILIFNFFNGLGGMAMIAAWWGVWHLISSFILAMIWGRNESKGILGISN